MTIEERLKELILKRYYSLREFTAIVELPYTTVDSIFRRGIEKSSISNVIKICKTLGISVDALADGEIVPVSKRSYPPRPINDYIEVKEILSDTRDRLTHSGFLTLDGNPIDADSVESIIDAIDIGVEIAKRKSNH